MHYLTFIMRYVEILIPNRILYYTWFFLGLPTAINYRPDEYGGRKTNSKPNSCSLAFVFNDL